MHTGISLVSTPGQIRGSRVDRGCGATIRRTSSRLGVPWLLALAVGTGCPSLAWADPPAAPLAADAGAPSATPAGVAVLAHAGAEAAGWGLAQEIYASAILRPQALDERRARVLVGGPAGANPAPEVTELVDERSGVRGEDGASRALLRAIASELHVRALVVVEVSAAGDPSARVFLADTGAFDAARYAPDAQPTAQFALPQLVGDGGTPASAAPASDGGVDAAGTVTPTPSPPPSAPVHWSGTVSSLERTFGAPPPAPPTGEPLHAPALATSALPPEKPKPSESHPFYLSPWFWGALGAAAFGGTAVYFATRDNSTGTIHLELQVPK
jgi:hypothetical protein